MNDSEYSEKRTLPRLLCSASFSDSRVRLHDAPPVTVGSVNFNRRGIGIFVNGRLGEGKLGVISFSFTEDSGQTIAISDLPFEMVYANETEVGGQYGLKFLCDDPAQQSQLEQIETGLAGQQSLADRYGLDDL